MTRAPRPDDVYRLRIATEPRLSPDGRLAVVTLKVVAPAFDGYRRAVWLVPTDGSRDPRQLTLGAGHDHMPRFSPDGRTLAFLSDRRALLEREARIEAAREGAAGAARERESTTQVHLLPLDGGEARRLTDLPGGVEAFEWSPDGTRLVVVSAARAATPEEDARRRGRVAQQAGEVPPASDYRFIDRLDYMLNGKGFVYDRVPHLWLVDVATGAGSRLTDGPVADREPAWSPDGRRIAFGSNRRRDADLFGRQDIHVVDVDDADRHGGDPRPAIGLRLAGLPARRRDDRRARAPAGGTRRESRRHLAVRRGRLRRHAGRRTQPVRFARPDARGGDEQRRHGRGRAAAGAVGRRSVDRVQRPDRRCLRAVADRRGRRPARAADRGPPVRVGVGRPGKPDRVPAVDARPSRRTCGSWTPVSRSEAAVGTGQAAPTTPRRLSAFNAGLLAEVELTAPHERSSIVDGRRIQGWFLPASGGAAGAPAGAKPLVVEIHGGPHTLYGWSPCWEFQLLAAAGIGVYYCNPRGSEGYGQAFNDANHRDWGPGPMRDVLAGVDALVADGLADPDRLGVTGGSYGGYLTNWIVAHDQRFRAAMTCRSVSDMTMLFLTGDISGGDWANLEFDATPWSDPAYYREISPISYADRITTPLLIQHSERDIRTTIGQAEALFTLLRSLRRPVRLMRVPEETHELTRSGTPFRRVENLRIVVDWFRHFLVDGKRGLPPLPRVRGGR